MRMVIWVLGWMYLATINEAWLHESILAEGGVPPLFIGGFIYAIVLDLVKE